MAGTTVIYNDVQIKDCQTERFDQTVQYDQSDTDAVYSRFVIRVAGRLHAGQLDFSAIQFGAAAVPGEMTDLAAILQSRLSHPRGEFWYKVGGDTLLYACCLPESPYVDVNNGPKPRRVEVTRVVGTGLLEVSLEIEICVVKCAQGYTGTALPGWPPKAAKDYKVLDNRWTCSEERDSTFAQTRTIEGTLRVKHASHWPQTFRQMVIPPLQNGYQRVTQRFFDTADGLSLKYVIVDRQRYMAPPPPATEWVATYTESSGHGDAKSYGQMHVALSGTPDTKKQDLLRAAMGVVLDRLRGIVADPESKDFSRLLHLAIVEHLHQCRIEINAQVLNVGIGDGEDDTIYLNTRIGRMGDTMTSAYLKDYDPKKWPIPDAYVHSKASAAWSHYWQDPCTDVHGFPGTGDLPSTGQSGTRSDQDEGAAPEYGQIAELPETIKQPGAKSQQQQTAPYTFFRLESDYETDLGLVHVPMAGTDVTNTQITKYDTTAVLRMTNGLSRRKIVIHAERVGAPPRIPLPQGAFRDDNLITYTLLRHKLYPDNPKLMPDGITKMYRVQAEYYYAMSRPPAITDKLPIGKDPRTIDVALDQLLDLGTLYDQGAVL